MNNRHFRLQGIRQAQQTANRNVGKLFLIGLASVAAYNWQRWQRDKALAERLRAAQTPAPALDNPPQVSALVAAWNEVEHIDAHIQSFLALRYPNIELVLCAGGYDGTLAKARLYAGERVIVIEQHAGEGKQKALARCYEHAHGDVIYLTDADCRFDDDALARLLGPIVNEGEHAATGGSRPLAQQADQILPAYLWASDVVAGLRNVPYTAGLLGRNAAATREAIDRSGGLDFEARTGTDYQLARRLLASHTKIRNVPASVVEAEYPPTYGEYQRRQSRWLRNLLLYSRRYGAAEDARATWRTIGTGLAMLAMPAFALRLGPAVLALWALIVAYAAGAKLRYAAFTERLYALRLPKRLPALLLPLTLVDFAIWASPIIDLLDPRRRERW